MAKAKLDILVIGGGITGAGIALDAASRGLRVGLVEKQDFCAGTSSRSTKLIHGGLRYLKQGDVKLVREVGQERAILYRNAPHIVIPERMLLPLVKRGTYGKFGTSIGLWVYDILAGVKKEERRRMLTSEETERIEGALRKDILKGGGLYIEYRTDDARLNIEVLKTASSYGALCANYTEATQFLYKDNKIIGCKVKDIINNSSFEIHARKIINATGPWVDQLRKKGNCEHKKRLHLTKGVHLVVPYQRFPLSQAIYFDVYDGRMIFAIPRDDITYIGTTDTDYNGVIENPKVTKEDVHYLLDAVNYMFPQIKLTEKDIASSWAGLRPLIHEEGKSTSEISRKDEIFHSISGLISIAGGKLTGYRKMAERVVDLVIEEFKKEDDYKYKPCYTDKIVLSGGDFSLPNEIPKFIENIYESAKSIGINKKQIASIVSKYGTNTTKIIDKANQLFAEVKTHQLEFLLLVAELQYTVEEEMVTNLSDFFSRRTGRIFFERPNLEKTYLLLSEEMKKLYNWNESQKNYYVGQFENELFAAVNFD